MKSIRQMLETKGTRVFSITSDSNVYDALLVMAEMGVGALLVIDNDKLVGIFSERDYARRMVLKGKTSKNTPVKDIMTTSVITVSIDNTAQDCMNLMTDKHVRHLPVMEKDKVVGLLSIGDLVKETIAQQEFLINQLTRYIRGDEFSHTDSVPPKR